MVGYVDEYPHTQEVRSVAVSLEHINAILGTTLTVQDVENVWKRLDLIYQVSGSTFQIEIPFERLDLYPPAGGPEDLIEEVGRIVGYDTAPSVELPLAGQPPVVNPNFFAAEKARAELVAQGYSDVYTSVFAEEGEREVLNKVGGERPFLRTTLVEHLRTAHERNMRNKELLGLSEVKLFEIGAVWRGGEERMMLGTVSGSGEIEEKPLVPIQAERYDTSYQPLPEDTRYQPFSRYPYIVRDVALWVPHETHEESVLNLICSHAGELLQRCDLFDRFEKGDRSSYAFRLVFQSFDKTLTDFDANERMESVYAALKQQGYEIR